MYSGHEEDGANHTEGVAIMMTKETRKALIAWEPISSRLITASFRTNNRRVKAHIIQCYAPTNDAVDDVKARFYDSLNHLLGRVGARDLIILMGDFNAKIGGRNEGYEEVKGKHGVGKMNENGEMFVETCVNNNLVIGGSVFPHKTIHKTTTNNRRVKAHIIQCYAPTNDAVDDVKARFYDSLNHLLGRVGARDLIILMGDFNAKIGGRNEGYEEVKGKHGVGKMNENGEMFVETCVNNNLVIGGSVFPHKTIHKTTVGARDLIILMGDFNAKIGGRNEGYEEVKGKHGVGKMNENGEMFVETCVNNNLVIGGRSSEGPWKMSEPEEEPMQHLTTICW
ncbi:hypothetical protein NHX12_023261 [Muraenolepis orangiensis]|uniref:Endonuclease/exonuclease/phosphatase domain-containing protein n=1 Tax=Muraenolepis orangiensis TaxID=630683 RepID=A0A9Q0EMS0_9TELE|nr:hypothetical protein NHX12_023261 [Muraenolepis orangiensis]